MSDPVVERVKELQAKGFDLSKLPEDVKAYLKEVEAGTIAEAKPVEEEKIVQEQHPSISFLDRAKIKNFGDDAMSSIAYLKEKNPDVEYDYKNNQIVAKGKGEKEWRVLDPSGFDLQDITDVAYDIPAGIAQGAATSVAGLAGGAFGAGAGAIPAAMAASGATGAGAEALRQYIGKMAGVNEMNGREIATSGAIGAAAPFLFGTGASKPMIKAALGGDDVVRNISSKLGNYIQKDEFAMTPANLKAAEEYLTRAQTGVLSRPIEKIGGFLSGIPEKVLGKMQQPITPYVKGFMEKAGYSFNPDDVVTTTKAGEIMDFDPDKFATKFVDTLKEETSAKRKELGDEISRRLDASGKQFDFTKYMEDLVNFMDDIKSSKNYTNADDATIKRAKQLVNDYLTTDVRIVDPNTGRMFRELDQNGKPIRKLIDNASASEAMRIKNSMNDFLDFASRGGSRDSPINKQLMQKFGGIHKKVSDDIYNAIDGGELRQLYRQNEEIGEYVMRKISSEDNALKALKNMDKKTFSILNSRLKQFDDLHGTQLSELGDVVQNWNYFAKPETVSVGGRGSEINRRAVTLGSLVGGTIGGAVAGPIGGIKGAAIGGSAGQLLTSPAAIKKITAMGSVPGKVAGKVGKVFQPATQKTLNYMSENAPMAKEGFSRMKNILEPVVKGGAVPSAWMLMNRRGEK